MMRIVKTEFLPNNIIDKEMQAFIRPLQLYEIILLHSKYTIRDNFITPNRRVYNVLSCMGMAVFIAIYLRISMIFIGINLFENVFYLIVAININISTIIFLYIAINNINNAENNVKLILDLHEAKNRVQFSDSNIKDLIIGNNIIIGIIVSMTIICSSVCYIYQPEYDLFYVIDEFEIAILDAYFVYATRIVSLLKRSIDVWLEEMKIRNDKCLRKEKNEFINWIEVQNAFCYLSEAYIAIQKIFSGGVSQKPFFDCIL